MPIRDTITVVGRNGQSHEFLVYPLDHVFEPLAAVYLVTARQPPDFGVIDYEILYIGKTSDLSTELAYHKYQAVFESHGANYIGVLIEPDSEKRALLARELSERLRVGKV
jgi:hypothetical protein